MSGGHGTLKLMAADGVKVYCVSGGKKLPEWVNEKKERRKLAKDVEYRRRIELIQDMHFPSACVRIKLTPDGQHMLATGTHPPQLRVFDLTQMAMKFDRHFDSEIVDFQILGEDYGKLAILCFDRSVAFHAKYGAHYRIRFPRQGRDMAYLPFLGDLVVVGSSPEIYRLSLVEGRFLSPVSSSLPGINACGWSPSHGLLACAGEDGVLECLDMRAPKAVGLLGAAAAVGADGQGLTAVRFDDAGMSVAVGTSEGVVGVFDLRSSRPLVSKDHMYGAPIVDIKFHQGGMDGLGERRVVSTDTKIVKIWDVRTGAPFTSIQPLGKVGDLNDACVHPHSGLIMVACDAPHIHSFFVPALGPAPKWCSFLESLTEELEENKEATIYDDYRFVTRAEIDSLGLTHLMGTALLRAYMHGFFIDARLYAKAKAIAKPFDYEEYKRQRVQEKLDAERKSRISVTRKAPRVNAAAAARMLERKTKGDGAGVTPLDDPRFKAMFEKDDFRIDEEDETYRALHQSGRKSKALDRELVREHFVDVDGGDEEEEDEETSQASEGEPTPARGPRMLAAVDDRAAEAFLAGTSLRSEREAPMGQRAGSAGAGVAAGAGRRAVGPQEVTFVPQTVEGEGEGEGRGGRKGGRGGRGRGRGRGGRGGVGKRGGRGGRGGRR